VTDSGCGRRRDNVQGFVAASGQLGVEGYCNGVRKIWWHEMEVRLGGIEMVSADIVGVEWVR